MCRINGLANASIRFRLWLYEFEFYLVELSSCKWTKTSSFRQPRLICRIFFSQVANKEENFPLKALKANLITLHQTEWNFRAPCTLISRITKFEWENMRKKKGSNKRKCFLYRWQVETEKTLRSWKTSFTPFVRETSAVRRVSIQEPFFIIQMTQK